MDIVSRIVKGLLLGRKIRFILRGNLILNRGSRTRFNNRFKFFKKGLVCWRFVVGLIVLDRGKGSDPTQLSIRSSWVFLAHFEQEVFAQFKRFNFWKLWRKVEEALSDRLDVPPGRSWLQAKHYNVLDWTLQCRREASKLKKTKQKEGRR
jgi:hypothetical protein